VNLFKNVFAHDFFPAGCRKAARKGITVKHPATDTADDFNG